MCEENNLHSGKCRSGYHDENPSHPGTVCNFIINECETGQNDCHKNGECIDLPGGYECRCKAPYRDESPRGSKTGRMCLLNECADPKHNHCAKEADCIDTDDSYMCRCRTGFYDASSDPNNQGRSCIGAYTHVWR